MQPQQTPTKALSFALTLLNSLLPRELDIKPGTIVQKGIMQGVLVKFALQDPDRFNETVPLIKQYGDMFARFSGISVGLDDIEPDYAKRNAVVERADKQLRETTDTGKRDAIYLSAQAEIRQITSEHKGDLGLMARSGGRGNINQLMKTIATPLVVGDFDGKPVDTLIKRSYAEGLSPMEYWVAADESRAQVIKGQLGVSEPGDMSKVLANTVNRQVVTELDCGTKNGASKLPNDPQIIGLFLARDQQAGRRNDEVTQSLLDSKKPSQLFVRTVLTCEASEGVCSYCQGTSSTGKRMQIGEHAGMRAAQAASEPLTQLALSSKHGVALVEGATNLPRGLAGVRQFLEAPKNFTHKAVISEVSGRVLGVREAPQGGNYVKVDTKEYYVPPGVKVTVKIGDLVHPGDTLSEGLPHPNELIQHKGLGEGRKYLVDTIHAIYKDSGQNIDKKNLEHIVKPHLNYVQVNSAPESTGFLPGEIIKQNRIDKVLRGQGQKIPVSQALGKMVSENYLHHVAGTKVTHGMMADFQAAGITMVSVLPDDYNLSTSPYVTSITRSPLLNDNWLNKLGHRYLKSTILEAAHTGQTAMTSGYAPLAAYARGESFGKGTDGKY
jgi:DNA-directed RNA polymerase subunit beta'